MCMKRRILQKFTACFCLFILMHLYTMLVHFALDLCIFAIYTMLCSCFVFVLLTSFNSIIDLHCVQFFNILVFLFFSQTVFSKWAMCSPERQHLKIKILNIINQVRFTPSKLGRL